MVDLLKRANEGDSSSQFQLGKILWEGSEDIKVDKKQALQWLTKAAEAGIPDYQMYLGCILCWEEGELRDFNKGLYWVQLAAEQGYIGAQYFLAVEYATGDNIKRDPMKAIHWYLNAAMQGHREAQYNLGIMYIEGDGVEKNFHEGQKWIVKSAENGELLAIVLLKNAYRDGLLGFQKDKLKYEYWKAKYDLNKRGAPSDQPQDT